MKISTTVNRPHYFDDLVCLCKLMIRFINIVWYMLCLYKLMRFDEAFPNYLGTNFKVCVYLVLRLPSSWFCFKFGFLNISLWNLREVSDRIICCWCLLFTDCMLLSKWIDFRGVKQSIRFLVSDTSFKFNVNVHDDKRKVPTSFEYSWHGNMLGWRGSSPLSYPASTCRKCNNKWNTSDLQTNIQSVIHIWSKGDVLVSEGFIYTWHTFSFRYNINMPAGLW